MLKSEPCLATRCEISAHGRSGSTPLAAQHSTAWAPPIDVYETEDRYVITAEVPGIARDQVELALQDNRLTIRGSRSAGVAPSAARHYQVERGHGTFLRTLSIFPTPSASRELPPISATACSR